MLKAAVLFFAPAALLCSAFAEEPEIMSGSYSNPLEFDVESASTLSAELAGRKGKGSELIDTALLIW